MNTSTALVFITGIVKRIVWYFQSMLSAKQGPSPCHATKSVGLRGTLNLICFWLIQIISNLVADGHLHPWSLRAATLVATPAVGLRVYRHFAPCNRWLRKVFAFVFFVGNWYIYYISWNEVSITSEVYIHFYHLPKEYCHIWVILRCWGNSSMVCQQNSDAL